MLLLKHILIFNIFFLIGKKIPLFYEIYEFQVPFLAYFEILLYLCSVIRKWENPLRDSRHIKKRLLVLVLEIRNPAKFRNPNQDGSKRPLGYDHPAAERPLWTALFGGFHISAWALLVHSCCRVLQEPLI